MSVLAGFGDGPDSLVVASDGARPEFNREYGVNLWRPVDKFTPFSWDGGMVAYGHTGTAVGDTVGWLRAVAVPGARWAELEQGAATWLRAVNATHRGQPQRDEAAVSVLLAGFVDGEAGLLGLTPEGERVPAQDGLVVVGPAAKMARGAWNAMDTPRRAAQLPRLLVPIVDQVCLLRGPVRTWHLTPSGMTEIELSRLAG